MNSESVRILRRRPASTAGSAPRVQRKCSCGRPVGADGECEECRKKRLQRRASSGGQSAQEATLAPPIVHDVLRGSGQALDSRVRRQLEPQFQHDFSGVRVHVGGLAAASAASVGALAYTVGRDVVFGAGQYAPGTASGDNLIAHELAHVVQQGGRPFAPGQALEIGAANDPLERQAESTGQRAGSAAAGSTAPRVQRAVDDATAGKPPASAVDANPCAGWLKDQESLSKRAAENYVKAKMPKVAGEVTKIECIPPRDNGAFACTVYFADGTPIRVIVRPDSIVVGKYPILSMNPGDFPLCWYAFSCDAGGQLTLTETKCQGGQQAPGGNQPPPIPPNVA